MRTRIRARFAELEQQRASISDQLTALDAASDQVGDPALLDAIPTLQRT
jgi:hypothetical protein